MGIYMKIEKTDYCCDVGQVKVCAGQHSEPAQQV